MCLGEGCPAVVLEGCTSAQCWFIRFDKLCWSWIGLRFGGRVCKVTQCKVKCVISLIITPNSGTTSLNRKALGYNVSVMPQDKSVCHRAGNAVKSS